MSPRELSPKEEAAYALNPDFKNAAERESKQLLKLPTTDELLELYGWCSLLARFSFLALSYDILPCVVTNLSKKLVVFSTMTPLC